MKSIQFAKIQEQLGGQKVEQSICKFWWVVLLLC